MNYTGALQERRSDPRCVYNPVEQSLRQGQYDKVSRLGQRTVRMFGRDLLAYAPAPSPTEQLE